MKAIIEMSKGTKYKYEYVDGQLTLDRPLKECVPANYGFIPNTLAPDEDSLDIFIVSRQPLVPGALVNVNVIGVFECWDQGVRDDKIIATLLGEEGLAIEAARSEIFIYLSSYKEGFEVMGYQGKDMADSIIIGDQNAFARN